MFFIVPDTNDAEPDNDKAASASSDGEKTSNSYVNVELDLDDAPFLEDEEPEKKPEAPAKEEAAPAVAMPTPQAEKIPFKVRLLALLKNKKLMIAVGAALILIIGAAIGVNMFLGGSSTPEPAKTAEPAPAAVEPRKIVVPTEPTLPPAPAEPAFSVLWEPFWVPLRGPEGEWVFFVCQFSVPTDDAIVNSEMQAKVVTLRDAVFYYFINKDLTVLLDKKDTVREELISVINEILTSGKVKKLYFKDYFVTDS